MTSEVDKRSKVRVIRNKDRVISGLGAFAMASALRRGKSITLATGEVVFDVKTFDDSKPLIVKNDPAPLSDQEPDQQ